VGKGVFDLHARPCSPQHRTWRIQIHGLEGLCGGSWMPR
jgi:hypothetical protein